MTEPLVVSVMLTKDRPAMAKRAVECWKRQTYKNRILAIFDTSIGERLMPGWKTLMGDGIQYLYAGDNLHWQAASIGELRNYANMAANAHESPVIIHWDDDDFSHPNRISEQVSLLQASGKQCVGYREMLFWRDGFPEKCPQCGGTVLKLSNGSWTCRTGGCELEGRPGEAWLYHNDDPRYCTGTSLAYYRSTWERRPFPDISRGEDKAWLREVDSMGISSIVDDEPRLIASIHGGNHVPYETTGPNWKRVPLWDSKLREIMAL